jgi:hypothetical protein
MNLPLFKSKIELNIYKPEVLMEDPFLPQLHSWCSSFGTTLEQKQQKFAASSPKTTGSKTLSMELLSKSYTTKEKTLKGILV